MITFTIKQGSTFVLGVTYAPGAGEASPTSAQCAIKTAMGDPVATVPLVSMGALTWQGEIAAAETASWPLGDCISDVRFTFADGSQASSDTFHLNIIQAVTDG